MTRYVRLKKDIPLWHDETYNNTIYATKGTIVEVILFTDNRLGVIISIGSYETLRPVTDLEFLE